ncbi:MAG: hypothetical protein NT018_07725 [Armatimonadetes bacterium]|nr:hypothetical protein [Armatimonadota bacterium]
MNRRTQANRTPWIVFGAIALLAIIVKLLSPPVPIIPGPKGSMQNWSSKITIGKMGPSAVNPAGTMWAGAWNTKDKEGKDQSAVWTIDFEKKSIDHKEYHSKTDEIKWTADNKVEPAAVTDNKVPTLKASDKKQYVLLDPLTGKEKPAFTQDQLPGIIQDSWVSPAGILILCLNQDKFTEVVFDTKTNKLNVVDKDGFKTNVKANWPDAPKEMLFVTYRGGFKVDIATGKTTKLFSYMSLKANDDHWRNNVQDGRLYPRKDGGYTSVSYNMGLVDIRALDKDGKLEKNLLPRY